MPKLKVFRTAIGFHDAYVAASSRKAALKAWGSEKDLFVRGAAEEVTDPALTADALAQPGVVIKRSRGSVAEQLAALPPAKAGRARKGGSEAEVPVRAAAKPAKRPKPSRDALDAAEAAVAQADAEQRRALSDLAEREAALARERAALVRQQANETRRLIRDRNGERAEYDAALAAWKKG
ncbi:MAG TPA: hypothetical protein VFQ57_00385 [Sphingomonas sp.]|jgi:hypothetical protein|nr:hypothetical protein [Sphingomonas sp.]